MMRHLIRAVVVALAIVSAAEASYLGDFMPNSTVVWFFTTSSAAGARIDPSSAWEAADLRCYKGTSTTERSSTNGYTITSTFDTMTGVTMVAIDLSDNTDAGFWAVGSEYRCGIYPDETVDGQSVTGGWRHFSIGRAKDKNWADNRIALKKGIASYIASVKVFDQRTGEPLTGVAWNAAGLACRYSRSDQGNNNPTTLTLQSATRGSYISGGASQAGWVEIQSGEYQLSLSSGIVAVGSPWARITCEGAANMRPMDLFIELTDATAQDTLAAVTTTGISELAVDAPPANPTLHQAIMAIYMALRNMTVTTATEIRYTNDTGGVIFKCPLTNAAGTFTKGECQSGP